MPCLYFVIRHSLMLLSIKRTTTLCFLMFYYASHQSVTTQSILFDISMDWFQCHGVGSSINRILNDGTWMHDTSNHIDWETTMSAVSLFFPIFSSCCWSPFHLLQISLDFYSIIGWHQRALEKHWHILCFHLIKMSHFNLIMKYNLSPKDKTDSN